MRSIDWLRWLRSQRSDDQAVAIGRGKPQRRRDGSRASVEHLEPRVLLAWTVAGTTTIADQMNGGPDLPFANGFGRSVTSLGDLDGDGVIDLAVGAPSETPAGATWSNYGAVHVLFMNVDGTVRDSTKIAGGINGGPTVGDNDQFGLSIESLGDLDGDGVTDLAVGAQDHSFDGRFRGAVYILFLNTDGTAKGFTKIANGVNGGPALSDNESFGTGLASLGDLDGDGVIDLAVGADENNDNMQGHLYVLFLNTDGTVKSSTKIDSGINGGPTIESYQSFGRSVASLGDLDGDGLTDVAVGAQGFRHVDIPENQPGAVYVLFMNADGTVKNRTIIPSGPDGPTLADEYGLFGGVLASAGDLDGDGLGDLAAAARDEAGLDGIQFLLMNADGTVKSSELVTSLTSEDGSAGMRLGTSLAAIGDFDGNGTTELAVGGYDPRIGAAMHIVFLESDAQFSITTLNATDEESLDWGDAPDFGQGGGLGNYETLLSRNGPRHTIVPGLFMGGSVDAEADAQTGADLNSRANGDDLHQALPDDEDGVNNSLDLMLTIGAQPTISVTVTNTTGSIATLFGWIDYDGNGVFSNTSERASVAVPTGIDHAAVTLTFPAVPAGFTGRTYARFRLSTDMAAGNPTGAVGDGEVEDYRVRMTAPSDGTADDSKTQRIADSINGGPALENTDFFGRSVIAIGDLNGDGVTDIGVGAPLDDEGEFTQESGAVYVLLMNRDGSVKTTAQIRPGMLEGANLFEFDRGRFGGSMAAVGDLDGDGVPDLAVGAPSDNRGGGYSERGAVYLLFMNSDGSVKDSTKIAHQLNGGPTLAVSEQFGVSVTSLGDLDGDGVTDLAVGGQANINAFSSDSGPGVVYILFMNADGTVKATTKIASQLNGGPTLGNSDLFGQAMAALGDLNGDSVTDLAVGARRSPSSNNAGVVYVLFLNSDGTVKNQTSFFSGTNGVPALPDPASFGISMGVVGDLDADGVTDLAVGASGESNGTGAVYVLFLNSNGTVRSATHVASGAGGGPTLASNDYFGSSVALLGDLNGDGRADLVVGAHGDDTGGSARGTVYVLFLTTTVTLPPGGGNYEILRQNSDIVVRVAGGAELFRRRDHHTFSLTINGSAESDVVTVLNSVSTRIRINGLGGNDILKGTSGETLDGGDGDDHLSDVGSGSNLLVGGAGNDSLFGGAERDTVLGGDGHDQVFGNGHSDSLSGGPGNDTINGGTGSDDTLFEAADVDFVLTDTSLTGLGSDVLAGVDVAFIAGGDSGNVLNGSGFTGRFLLDGRGGDDSLTGTGAPALFIFTTLAGGSGTDRLVGMSDSANFYRGASYLFDIEEAHLIGGPSANNISATSFSGPVTLEGGGGDDTLTSGVGNDVLIGGSGNDLMRGSEGNDSLSGGPGNDRLEGEAGVDTLVETADVNLILTNGTLTGVGTDTLVSVDQARLSGGVGNNTLDASGFSGPATLDGAAGNDSLLGGTANDSLLGGIGNDSLRGSDGNDRADGGDGDDHIADVASGDDSLSGGAGNDSLFGGAGRDFVTGGDGNDQVFGNGGSHDTVSGGPGNDRLDGGAGSDLLDESADANLILTNTSLAGAGNDALFGLERAQLIGGPSGNTIDATAFSGPVTLDGGGGNDSLRGGPSNDVLVGGTSDDTIRGGDGDDLLRGLDGNDSLDGGNGNDTVKGGTGNDSLVGGAGNDGLAGRAGNDHIIGFDGEDTLLGGIGNDTLLGAAQNDIALGGDGDDYVDGQGASFDTVAGNDGNDTVFGSASEIDESFMLDPAVFAVLDTD